MSEQHVHDLIKKAVQADDATDAMKFSQAACNAAGALAVLKDTSKK